MPYDLFKDIEFIHHHPISNNKSSFVFAYSLNIVLSHSFKYNCIDCTNHLPHIQLNDTLLLDLLRYSFMFILTYYLFFFIKTIAEIDEKL